MLCSLRYTATHSNLVKSHVVSVWKAVAALSLNQIYDQNWKIFFSIYLTLLLFLWKKYKLTASRNQVQFQFCVAKLGSLSRFVSHAIWTLPPDGRLTVLIVFLSLFFCPLENGCKWGKAWANSKGLISQEVWGFVLFEIQNWDPE